MTAITQNGFNINEGLDYLRKQFNPEPEEQQQNTESDPYAPLLKKAEQMQADLFNKTEALLSKNQPQQNPQQQISPEQESVNIAKDTEKNAQDKLMAAIKFARDSISKRQR